MGPSNPAFGRAIKPRSIRFGFLRLLAILLALALASSAVLIWSAYDVARQQAKRQMLDTTRALSRVVDGEFARSESLLHALAISPNTRAQDWSAVDNAARTVLSDPNEWVEVTDRNGQQLVNTSLPLGAPLSKRPVPSRIWPILDRGETHICDLTSNAMEPQVFCVDVPVMVNGKAEYYMSVVMAPRGLAAILERQRLPSDWHASIIDSQGKLVWRSHAPDRFIGKSTHPDILAALRRSDEGVLASRSFEGIPTYAAYSRSPSSRWSFFVSAPRWQLDAGIWPALLGSLLTVVLLMIVGVIAAFHWTRVVARAVEGLAAQAGALGRRESFVPSVTPILELNEIGDALSTADRTLRRRDAQLAQLNASLTQRVDITTAERETALAQLHEERASRRPAN